MSIQSQLEKFFGKVESEYLAKLCLKVDRTEEEQLAVQAALLKIHKQTTNA